MKLLSILILSLTLIFAGCSSTEDVKLHENELMNLKLEDLDVKNGSGTQVIGKRGYIETEYNDISEVDLIKLKQFYLEKIEGQEYNYFNVILKDGNALTFLGGNDSIVNYGPINETGQIENAIGVYLKTGHEDNPYRYMED